MEPLSRRYEASCWGRASIRQLSPVFYSAFRPCIPGDVFRAVGNGRWYPGQYLFSLMEKKAEGMVDGSQCRYFCRGELAMSSVPILGHSGIESLAFSNCAAGVPFLAVAVTFAHFGRPVGRCPANPFQRWRCNGVCSAMYVGARCGVSSSSSVASGSNFIRQHFGLGRVQSTSASPFSQRYISRTSAKGTVYQQMGIEAVVCREQLLPFKVCRQKESSLFIFSHRYRDRSSSPPAGNGTMRRQGMVTVIRFLRMKHSSGK